MVSIGSLDDAPSGRERLFEDPKTVALVLDAGDSIPAHEHPGTTIVLAVHAGELRVTLDDDPHEVGAGDVLRFAGDRSIAIDATADARALLVLIED